MDIQNDINESEEKTKKYGNPKTTLIITGIVIFIIAVLSLMPLCFKTKITGITGEFAVFYPSFTMFYIDAKVDTGKNNSAKLGINSMSDLLYKVFNNSDYQVQNNEKTRKLLSAAIGDSFSFGCWDNEKSLAVFSIKRESEILPLFQSLLGKKLINKNFKGYKIITTLDKKESFLISQDKLFVAENYKTLTYIINNHILNNSDNLLKKREMRDLLSFLEKDRIGTIIFTNIGSKVLKFGDKIDQKFQVKLNNLQDLSKSLDLTAASVLLDKNNLNVNFYTPCKFSKIHKKTLISAIDNMFSAYKNNFKLDFLPQNTIGFVLVNKFQNYIDFLLELTDTKEKPEFEQFKQLINSFMSIDFEDSLKKLFNDNTMFLSVNFNNKPKYALILNNNNYTDSIISKLAKLGSNQSSSFKVFEVTYKNINLNSVKIPGRYDRLLYGKISENIYVLGEEQVVEAIINKLHSNKPNILDKTLQDYPINDFRLLTYIDPEMIDKLVGNKSIYISKIKHNVKTVLFSVKSNGTVIKSSLQLGLK